MSACEERHLSARDIMNILNVKKDMAYTIMHECLAKGYAIRAQSRLIRVSESGFNKWYEEHYGHLYRMKLQEEAFDAAMNKRQQEKPRKRGRPRKYNVHRDS